MYWKKKKISIVLNRGVLRFYFNNETHEEPHFCEPLKGRGDVLNSALLP